MNDREYLEARVKKIEARIAEIPVEHKIMVQVYNQELQRLHGELADIERQLETPVVDAEGIADAPDEEPVK